MILLAWYEMTLLEHSYIIVNLVNLVNELYIPSWHFVHICNLTPNLITNVDLSEFHIYDNSCFSYNFPNFSTLSIFIPNCLENLQIFSLLEHSFLLSIGLYCPCFMEILPLCANRCHDCLLPFATSNYFLTFPIFYLWYFGDVSYMAFL